MTPALRPRRSLLLAPGNRAEVHAGALAAPADIVCLACRDPAAVRAEAESVRALGFTGKAVIHRANLAVVHAAFAPTDEAVAQAGRVVAVSQASPNGLAVLDGKFVERPVIRAMQRILALRASMSPAA